MPPDSNRVTILGLGYVGLPLASAIIDTGLTCYGVDPNPELREGLLSGRSHIDDVTNLDIQRMLDKGFQVTGNLQSSGMTDVIIICVPTPLSDSGGPDITAIVAAAREIMPVLRAGQLIILESTTYPGTTEEILVPILEESGLRAGVDFNCAFSPERIDPGNSIFGLRNTPKVVGGLSQACATRAYAFYSQFVDTVVIARGVREAEMTKLLENTYRHVNIALVNEMANFCHELEIDLWDVIRCASSKPFGFEAFFPGPGVGGHCIPIDPNYLAHRVRSHLGQPFRFVELAQEINAGMPAYVVRRAQDLLNELRLPVMGSKVALLGVTYKPNIADQRESPSIEVARGLIRLGASVRFHDPLVQKWNIGGTAVERYSSAEVALAESDIAILLQAHRDYDLETLGGSGALILDTRGVLKGSTVHAL